MEEVIIPKVKQLYNNAGNAIANHYIVQQSDGTEFFISYDKVIVMKDKKGNIYLDENYHDYSKTTTRYRNTYLLETNKRVKELVKNETYKLKDLNK